MISQDKVVGTLLGCAIGDALGMPVEGWPAARIKKHVGQITEMIDPIVLEEEQDEFGAIHNWTKDFSLGEYTDDTIFTLEIAESIIEDPTLCLDNIAQRHIRIYEEYKAGHLKGGFGGTTKKAIRNLQKGFSWAHSGVYSGMGTGPCMKMSPVGIWAAFRNSFQNVFINKAFDIGRMTHKDPRSANCGVLQAIAIYRLINSSISKENLIETLVVFSDHFSEGLENCKFPEEGKISEKFSWIKENMNVSVEEAHEYLGSGFFSTQAYPFTIWMFQKFWDKPLEGLQQIVNCGGDCDTTGSMFGALVGAKWGNIFPEDLANQLKEKDKILRVSKELYDCLRENYENPKPLQSSTR